jgi:hypothetical protein
MVHRTSFVTVVFVLAAAGAHAQETLPQAPPAAPSTPAAPAAATAPRPGAQTQGGVPNLQRIYHIRQLEAMLTNAVKAGANSLAGQLKVSEPTSLFVTGNARTRGFELEGYGVFFDVDVPTMMQSVAWSTQMLQQQQYLDFLQRSLADPGLDDTRRRMASIEMQRVQRAMANGQIAQIPVMPPGAPAVTQSAAQGIAVAQTTDAPAALVPAATMPDPRTPDELYTDAIKGALIDAMLSYGNALQLGDDEWLTIAARATNQRPAGQGIDDSSSILIRVKGSDLSAFLKGKMSREDVLKKIEIKEG